MTKEMLEEYVKAVKRKNNALIIAIIILCIALAVCVTLLFCEFETTETVTYEITTEQDTTDGGDNHFTSENGNTTNTTNDTTVILCVLIGCATLVGITYLLVSYGKSKNKNKIDKDENSPQA